MFAISRQIFLGNSAKCKKIRELVDGQSDAHEHSKDTHFHKGLRFYRI